ncbi:TIR domain-containing adapter molecule 2-like [Struthio camelus]|uniref:TIR domain-containing adapter molecule 2-like n=2 Tax=Struthio camelus TaxID=8801 RepID=UPI003603DCEB
MRYRCEKGQKAVELSVGVPEDSGKKAKNMSTGQRDSEQVNELCGLSAEIREPASGSPGVCSGNENIEGVFYKFVILHAENDVDEAIRIQNLLQNKFCIKPGIIFAEMPCGKHILENLSDAVNGSAWTIILLTENFLNGPWCEFQSYTCLVNALNKRHKYNSVIPVRPLNNPLPREKTPFALQAINALEEDSPGFAKQVERIFQESTYRQQREIWRRERMKEKLEPL